jgi:NDP-sugar pyrophosphorylase family protein
MRAMILAAGKGTRLRPLTDTVPKPLLEVAGRPMIAFPLQLLREAGIEEVVINLHHLSEQIRNGLGDGSAYGVRIAYSEEDPILDSGGAIAAAKEFLCGGTFVVLNADTAIDLRLRDVIDFHRQHQATATMVVRQDPDAARHDAIMLDASHRMHSILGHDDGTNAVPDGPGNRMMYAGIMVLEPRVFDHMGQGVFSITRDVFPRLLAAGERLYGYIHEGYWRVLDTLTDLAAGREELAQRGMR